MTEETLFAAALEKETPTERAAFLDQSCAGDDALRRRVEALLESHENPDFLRKPAVGQAAEAFGEEATLGIAERGDFIEPAIAAQVGTILGPYKLLEEIGEGGMGTVFLAEQTHPVRRSVALKLIKAGMDSRLVLARFSAERQALALMDHPNIAKVLDAGASVQGRPYFVMELVKGTPITRYCDEHRLTPKERIELFLPVCAAVQHAHQKGIIHRDLKPSNVLVGLYDGKPVPKIIDFGIAKAVGVKLTEQTLFTGFGAVIGTPEYMSPEQAQLDNVDIDTRADIYSLGILLYELLTGTTPLKRERVHEAAVLEVLRIIREEDPPKPSSRLSTTDALPSIAANRSMEPRRLTGLVHGDLDWIVMKCLEKDRNRRYETASNVAEDVGRFLSNQPVSAGPPSRLYRARKFIQRNRGLVVAASSVVLVLIAGITGTTIGLVGQSLERANAIRQKQEAEKMFEIAAAVTDFQREMFDSVSPYEAGDKVTVLEVMTLANKRLDAGRLKDKPIVEANVRDAIGTTIHELGRYAEAEPILRRALDLRRSSFKSPHIGIALSLGNLARTVFRLGRLNEAEALLREALQTRGVYLEKYRKELADTLLDLGDVLEAQGRYAESESYCRESLALDREILPAGHVDLAYGLARLGWVLQAQDKFVEAESLCREALSIRRRNLPTGHPLIGDSLNYLAVVLARSNRLAEAEPLFRELLSIQRKALPPEHPMLAQSINNLATALQEQGKHAEAEPLQREGLKLRREALPEGHPDIAQSLKNLAVLLSEQGKFVEAELLAREALEIRRAALPAAHPDIAGSLQQLGVILADLGRFADSEAMLLDADRILSAAETTSAATRVRCVEALVRLYTKWDQAEPDKGHGAKAKEWNSKLPANPKP